MKPIRSLLAALLLLASPCAFASDLTVTAGNVKPTSSSTKTARVRFGEAVTQGQPVYKSTDGKYYKADADASGKDAAVGIAITPASTDEYGYIVTEGLMNVGATLTVGVIYCVSDAAGGIRPSTDNGTGDKVTILGVATTSSVLWVKPFASGTAVP
jgi:hypothetical protein